MAKKKKPPKKKTRTEEPVLKGAGFKKSDIAQKLIPLSVLSGKEAEKNAERAIDNVLSAIIHVLGEGDLMIADFGGFKASKSPKTGYIRITFTPSGRLKQAVEARLHANPSPDPDATTESSTQTDPSSGSSTGSQSSPPSTPIPEPTPAPPAPPALEETTPSGTGPAPETGEAQPCPVGEIPGTPAAGSYEQSVGSFESGLSQETSGTYVSGGSDAAGEAGQPQNGGYEQAQGSTEPVSTYQAVGAQEPAGGYEAAGSYGTAGGSYELEGSYVPAGGEYGTDSSASNESSEILNIDSVSAEERSLMAGGQEYKLAENLTILDVNGNVMNFAEQIAALQHLALVSRIIVISKTLLRMAAVSSAISIITTLQILQYRG